MITKEQLARALPQHKYDNPAYDDHAYCLVHAEKIVSNLRRLKETPMDDRVDPAELRERLRRASVADEQIDALDHVLAALTNDLTWDQIDKLGVVVEKATDLWVAALKARVRS